MAILEEVPGIKITVRVNHQDVVEYDDPHASEQEAADATRPTSCKYIESIDDAHFGVRVVATRTYRWDSPKHDLSVSFWADGHFVACRLIRKSDLQSKGAETIKGKQSFDHTTQQWYIQQCKFAAVRTVDDGKRDRVKSDEKVAAQLGVIEVRLRRIRVVGERRFKPPPDAPTAQSDGKYELAEKSLKGKAISHGTAFSRGRNLPAHKHYDVEPIPGDRGHLAIYRFYYKSRDALRQEMIIPRSPSPETAISDLSRAEIERLARERLEQIKGEGEAKRERQPGIKREADEVLDLTGEQPRSRPAKRRQPVVVDLTDD